MTAATVFYSDVRDLIQTVVLPDTTTQTQNVGNGDVSGVELSAETPLSGTFRVGGNYTYIHRVITDALQPKLRPTGVPTNTAFLYATWQPIRPLRLTPNLEFADDRWSDKTTTPATPSPGISRIWDPHGGTRWSVVFCCSSSIRTSSRV